MKLALNFLIFDATYIELTLQCFQKERKIMYLAFYPRIIKALSVLLSSFNMKSRSKSPFLIFNGQTVMFLIKCIS